MSNAMLTEAARGFLDRRRVAHLATSDAAGAPHVMPVCFAVADETVYITVDEKPKRTAGRRMKRIRNILENPQAALVADHYDDHDWSRLGWVMLQGRAEVLDEGREHDSAQAMLSERYPQMRDMDLADKPVIAIRVARALAWGDLGR